MRKGEKTGEQETSEYEPALHGTVKRYSIFWVLTILLVTMVVIPLISFAVKAINTSKTYLEDTLRERQAKTAIAAASHIQSLMREPEDKLKTIAAAFEIYASDPDVTAKYEEILEHKILDHIVAEHILMASFSDKNGTRIQSSSPRIPQEQLAMIDPLIWQLASEAQRANGLQYSKVFLLSIKDETSATAKPTPVRFLAVPLHKGGEPIAALVIMATLTSIQDALVPYGREFTMLITDNSGKILFNSDPDAVSFSDDFSRNPLAAWALREGVISSSTVNSSVSVDEDGKKKIYLVTCSPILEYEWLLFSYVDRGQFFTPISVLQAQSTVWVVLSILSALLFGIFVARQITKPISNLTEVSRELAHGNWGSRADVRTKNEVGELGEAFNFMALKIQKYIHEVEAKAEENKQLFMSSISAIANAIDAKDPYTRGHSQRVSAYSVEVAKEYGFDERGIRIVEIASLLHDVGKIGIEDRILRKPGSLTAEEFGVMKTHPGKGAEILGSILQMKEMIPGIRHHHERWNGGGYPDNLKSSKIPILARIIGVADAFDAMTTDRPYQKAMTFVMAATRINELTPAVYDPDVTEAFNNTFRMGVFEKIRIKSEKDLKTSAN
jgi:HD-GYP domain-containing protein (c-di-GMP phosphodiesterase class II)